MIDKTTMGKFTKVGIGKGAGATTFNQICVMGDFQIPYGTDTINEETGLCSDEPFVSVGQTTFGEQTYQYPWAEGTGDVATKIIKEAKLAKTKVGKTITIQYEMANSVDGTKKGTLYTANFLVTGYQILVSEGGINKSEFTVKQLNAPVEKLAAV